MPYFSPNGFMPHGHCYLWQPGLVATHAISDLLIGAAYLLISLILYALVRKIRLPFSPMFIAFGVFIAACGMTHFMEVWTLWHPDYWFSGFVKVVTAVASVATGLVLIPIRPKVISIAEAAKLSEERKSKLEAAYAELEVLYEKIRESDVLKTQFFANVSHELRTPLSLILGPVAAVTAEGHLSVYQRQQLDVVVRNAKTLLKQVNDLLDISKLEAGRLKPCYVKCDLVQLFRFVAAHFETNMQARSIFFTLTAPESLLVEVDPDKIQRVFMNLLSNAIKFVPEGGRIRVSIKRSEDEAIFQIEDTGPGVPPEFEEVIFERFRQVEGGVSRKLGGTGLGLAIVKEFVQMHNGRVSLLSGHAPGATFVVRLPVAAPPGTQVESAAERMNDIDKSWIESAVEALKPQLSPALPDVHVPGRPLILVCEDNPDMNRFIAETLAFDFNIIRAVDGRDGLLKARAAQPDLVVSDIMMPHMGGDQLVVELKKDDTLRDIPILLLSAQADDTMRVKLLREGASDYLVKPFASEELRARAWNLVSLKKTRDVLAREVAVKSENIVDLATALAAQKREAEAASERATLARKEAEKASQVKSAFLNLVSHELKTPLSTMILSVELLEKREQISNDATQKRILNRLSSSLIQQQSLVDGLLEYVRSGSSRSSKHEKINLNQLVVDTVEELKPLAETKKIELRSRLSLTAAYIESDRAKMKVILNNLITNAIKFTDKGFVEVEARSGDKAPTLLVRDSGAGIRREDQARIFEPFERVEPLERKSVPGIGLGLALVKQLATALGAQIELESDEGQGSTFVILLPETPRFSDKDQVHSQP